MRLAAAGGTERAQIRMAEATKVNGLGAATQPPSDRFGAGRSSATAGPQHELRRAASDARALSNATHVLK